MPESFGSHPTFHSLRDGGLYREPLIGPL